MRDKQSGSSALLHYLPWPMVTRVIRALTPPPPLPYGRSMMRQSIPCAFGARISYPAA
jgi:hypothetical protein